MAFPDYRRGERDRDPEFRAMERDQAGGRATFNDRWQNSYSGMDEPSKDRGYDDYGNRFSSSYRGSYGQLARTTAYDRAPTGFRGRGPKGYRRSDERIREDVCELLTDDPRVDASNIDVSVGTGEVTLSGTVLTREEKRLAEDLAERVSGVWDVQNCLTIAADEARGE
jgi:osmotically-inducible protein OsmY